MGMASPCIGWHNHTTMETSGTVRTLAVETVEGEIGIVIDYEPGKAHAIDVLQGAMNLIAAIDGLDRALLSSVDTSLEPISVLNDVQHSSLKILLKRALNKVPDDLLASGDWKKWVGALLVKGKYLLLNKIDADSPEIALALNQLEPIYKAAPVGLVGYNPPSVVDVRAALDNVASARATLRHESVTVQTEYGDVVLEDVALAAPDLLSTIDDSLTVRNKGVEYFKVKSTDMLGQSQWTVLRNNRQLKVSILHEGWLRKYQQREFNISPGDSLLAAYEETVRYDTERNEVDRTLAIVEVREVISPPVQHPLC